MCLIRHHHLDLAPISIKHALPISDILFSSNTKRTAQSLIVLASLSSNVLQPVLPLISSFLTCRQSVYSHLPTSFCFTYCYCQVLILLYLSDFSFTTPPFPVLYCPIYAHNLDFLSLIFIPYSVMQLAISSITLCKPSSLFAHKHRSSAYIKPATVLCSTSPCSPTETYLKPLSLFCTIIPNSLTFMLNSKGDRGQPCLTPGVTFTPICYVLV